MKHTGGFRPAMFAAQDHACVAEPDALLTMRRKR